jgi:hypothetical protein
VKEGTMSFSFSDVMLAAIALGVWVIVIAGTNAL